MALVRLDGLRPHAACAGQLAYDGGLVLLAEVDDGVPADRLPAIADDVRAALVDGYGLVADDVALVAAGTLPRDPAGGIARGECLTGYRRGAFDLLCSERADAATRPAPASGAETGVQLWHTEATRPRAEEDTDDRLTLDGMRRTVVDLLEEEPSSIGEDDDLIGWGLDSIRIMQLVNEWRRAGADVKFADLIERPTLGEWWSLISNRRGARSQDDGELEIDESEPFALTPVQHAYWIGRADGQALGGVGCHAYLEFDGYAVEPERLERAVKALFRRHGLLRARFLDDGRQQILPQTPWPGLTVHDLRRRPAEAVDGELASVRDRSSHRRLRAEQGEVFDVQLSLLPGGRTRIHVNLDLMAADVRSIQVVLDDLAMMYVRPDDPPGPLTYGFPYHLALRERRRAEDREKARAYWRDRLDDLPGAPQLPLAIDPGSAGRPRFTRQERWLSPGEWRTLADRARAHGITPSMMLVTAYAEVLAQWSAGPRFLLNLPLFDRDELDPSVPRMVGDFTNLLLLAVDATEERAFLDRAQDLLTRFQTDVSHAEYSGVEVLRDLTRARHGEQVTAPVVFTSGLGMGDLFSDDVKNCLGTPGWMISQTPQVWLDHQVVERDGGVLLSWDAVEGLFPDGVLDGMFGAYVGLLEWLADSEADWSEPVPPLLPEDQRRVRDTVNETTAPIRDHLLHDGFFAQAAAHPDRVALAWGEDGRMSYGELAGRALRLAGALRERDLAPGEPVAVTLPKGPDQVVAVLGILAAGGAYVPVGADQPARRRERIYARAGVRLAVTRTGGAEGDTEQIPVTDTGGTALARPVRPAPDTLAYVIFTSGSTGEPKGVEVTHRSAMNTIDAINARYAVDAGDRVLAVSALDFDLSVYDVFGLLTAGGGVVLIDEDARRDAHAWLRLIERHAVTIWNTVPTLLDMLLIAGERNGVPPGLRLAMVSGDWVGLDLPGRLRALAPGCRLAALGGATEAAIWSNVFEVTEVRPDWRSIPYGHPLPNQRFRVVDSQGRDKPDWVAGELWIGGLGVARGYRGDPEQTAGRFVQAGGDRWYRTGDLGRYWPDGTLEFLGRADHQIKIRGHRVELGEIEATMQAHPEVAHAVAAVVDDPVRRLVAAVVPARGADGPEPGALREWIAERLPAYMVPDRLTCLDALPLTLNGKVDRQAVHRVLARDPATGAPEQSEPPAGPLETLVAAVWADLLEVPYVGRGDDFFALGGDSLLATRLVNRLRAERLTGAELSRLFEYPVFQDFAGGLAIGGAAAPPPLEADPAHRHEPFPPTDVQRAYWMGRTGDFTLGGVGTHYYVEFDGEDVDLDRLEDAWNRLIARHEMLRAVFLPDGRQRILPEVPRYTIAVTTAAGPGDAELAELRDSMSHGLLDQSRWPIFEVRAVRYGDRTRVAFSLDYIILDYLSLVILVSELDRLYADPGADLPPVEVSFRDYVQWARQPEVREPARQYWDERLAELPPAPRLPLATDPAGITAPRFTRREAELPADRWNTIIERARRHGITPSTVLLTCYAEVLAAWTAQPELTINLTLFDRREVHPHIENILGDFTSLLLVAYRAGEVGEGWLDGARRLQRQVWRDLEHREVSAVWVMRRLAQRLGVAEVAMPVVFSSALGVAGDRSVRESGLFAEPHWMISQTPQVWLDHQVVERDGGVSLSWDAVEGLFPDGVLDGMFGAYVGLLEWLADAEDDWSAPVPPLLPDDQRRVRESAGAPYRVLDPRGRDCPDWVVGRVWTDAGGCHPTGELGRHHPDGTVEILGPADRYAEVRGRLVDLDEIGAALAGHPDITDACAIADRGRLVAFAVPAGPDLDIAALGPYLSARLPAHAVPPAVIALDALPRDATGAIDRDALADPRQDEPEDAPPRGDVERELAGIWAGLLGLTSVGRAQNFFSLGGDSVLATRLVEEVHDRLGADLSMRRFFEAPTVAGLAAAIAAYRDAAVEYEEGAV